MITSWAAAGFQSEVMLAKKPGRVGCALLIGLSAEAGLFLSKG
jgi:hypothetical protein